MTEKNQVVVQAMEDDAITKGARHSGKSCAPLYFGIVMTNWKSYGAHKKKQWPLHKVSNWDGIYLGSGDNYAHNTDYSTQWTKSLCDLSWWFVSEELGVSASSGILEWEKLLELALVIPESVGLLESLDKVLDGLGTTAEQNLAKQLVRELIAQEVARTLAPLQSALALNQLGNDGGGNGDADGGEGCSDGNNQPVALVVRDAEDVVEKRQRFGDSDHAQPAAKRARNDLELDTKPAGKQSTRKKKSVAGVHNEP